MKIEGLSQRATNCLAHEFYIDVDDLDSIAHEIAAKSDAMLLRMPNCGKTTTAEIRRWSNNRLGVGENMKVRKIVQITDRLFALCDDGSVWRYELGEEKWYPLSEIQK